MSSIIKGLSNISPPAFAGFHLDCPPILVDAYYFRDRIHAVVTVQLRAVGVFTR